MRTIQYIGPYDVVVVAATGQQVGQGETVDIEDDALATSLCEQLDNWKPVGWTPEYADGSKYHPGTGVEMHGIDALPDGTETELAAAEDEDVAEDDGDDD